MNTQRDSEIADSMSSSVDDVVLPEDDSEPEYVRKVGAPVRVQDIELLSDQIGDNMKALKDSIFKPHGVKRTPIFNAAQVATLCGKTPGAFQHLLRTAEKKDLPTGLVKNEQGKASSQRRFTLSETLQWVTAISGKAYKRKPGQNGAVISVGFYKGGVGKTQLASSLAQGLVLKSYKVLLIDLDGQGSASTLLGVDPATVAFEETIAPLCVLPSDPRHNESLVESIRPTYWENLNIVAGSNGLFECEFWLPLRAMQASQQGQSFNFMEVLNSALDLGIRSEFDYIIIDTPPSLSYTVMQAYWASDAILMPVVPEGLSLQSSVQFWDQFAQLAGVAQRRSEKEKEYAWIGVVPSKVEPHKPNIHQMSRWLRMFYGEYVLNTELPLSEAVKTGGTEYSTIYDIAKYAGSMKTYQRARDAYDNIVDEVDTLTRQRFWHEPIKEQ